MTYDEALQLPADERIEGIVVAGAVTPFGGSWDSSRRFANPSRTTDH